MHESHYPRLNRCLNYLTGFILKIDSDTEMPIRELVLHDNLVNNFASTTMEYKRKF